MIRHGKKGKLSPRYIGPFETIKRVGPVAYQLKLPPQLGRMHDVFHVSLLRKYHPDPSHVIQLDELELNDKLLYEEKPILVLDRRTKVLRNKEIPLVLVL